MNFFKTFNFNKDFWPLFFITLIIIGVHFMASTTFLGEIHGLGLLGLIILLIIRKQKLSASGYRLPFLLFFLSALLAAIFSPLPDIALGEVFSVVGLVAVYSIIVSALSQEPQLLKKNIDFLIKLFFIGLLLNIFFGLYQYTYFNFFDFETNFLRFVLDEVKGGHRAYGLFLSRSGTSVFSAYLSLILPPTIFLIITYFKKNNFWGKLWLLLLLFLIFALFTATLSRALLLIFFAVFFTVLFLKAGKRRWLYLGNLVVFFMIAFFMLPPMHHTVTSLFNKKHSSNIDHIFTKAVAWRLICERPLTGWGGGLLNARLKKDEHGQWINVRKKYKTEAEKKPATNYPLEIHNEGRKNGVIIINTPHNIYLTYFLEFGILGLMALCALFIACWQKLVYAIRQAPKKYALLAEGLLYGLVSFMLYGLFHDSLKAPIMAAFFVLFLILANNLKKLSDTDFIK